jgi:hypothetical protein
MGYSLRVQEGQELKLTSHQICEKDKESDGSAKLTKCPLVLLVKVDCRKGKILGSGKLIT